MRFAMAMLLLLSVPASSAASQAAWQALPTTSTFSQGIGTLLVWSDTRRTLAFVEIPLRYTCIAVDARGHLGRLDQLMFSQASPLLVVSGGTWTLKDGPVPRSEGLVISAGKQLSDLHPKWQAGGILVEHSGSLAIVPLHKFKQLHGITEALQSPSLIVEQGKRNPSLRSEWGADRVAIGISDKTLVVAIVMHEGERTTTLAEFAAFVADVAKMRELADLNVINLDGACAAQLYIPALKKLFSCGSVSATPNRILVWRRNDTAPQ